MLMRQAGTVLVALAVIAAGFLKQERLKNEVCILKDYELALEQLRESICFEKLALKQALIRACEGKNSGVQNYLKGLAEDLNGTYKGKPDVLLQEHAIPVGSLSAAGQAQERILLKLTEEVRSDRLQREKKLDERCRSSMSVAVAVSAICAIVLL